MLCVHQYVRLNLEGFSFAKVLALRGVGKTTNSAITGYLLSCDFDSQGNMRYLLIQQNIYDFTVRTILQAVKERDPIPIDAPGKNRRKRISNMEIRREQGVRPRHQYVKEQHKKTDENLIQVKEILDKGLNQKEIADQLGLSKGRISQLVKLIKKI
jgi:hypothetical protein